ncbi:phospholipase D family protein [Thiobacillus sedimenti]|uniref:Phospholipase D family protein n=1 Tax=Thiobacillus sedimenti TaxID=3110231 RepID=A0ABZ1CP10_9PROT|nr:phospholipase D family protein [Thiobacillus sp. SCUT-2]WRS40047.1 phospholipase D family protein [Thiobacillus sp. SCUT-2]
MSRRPERLACLALAAALLAGCAPTLNLDARRLPSQAISTREESPLKERLAAWIPPGESGFHLLEDDRAALAARLALAARASRTLDVQYYLFHNDTTGKMVAAALLAAAERGVRVRLLIDDIDAADKDLGLATLNAHPNIQVRLFNPFHTRSTSLLVKGWQALRERVRLNRRMHNKLFIADNQLGITGGRNIGDEYFGADHRVAFVDLDVLAGGAVVDAMSHAFDAYWNSQAAVPASALPVRTSEQRLQRTIERLVTFRAQQLDSEYGRALTAADPLPGLLQGTIPWRIARADLIVDPPDKVLKRHEATSQLLLGQFAGLGLNPARRALIVSPYFVPGATGMAYFEYWRSRGVQVDVLTNAYSASDVPIVHAGYANYRVPLLEAGVNLYELKPVAEPIGGRLRDLRRGSSRASLHAKTFVFDDEYVFIGSFNFDPRSTLLNTEMGLVIHSPEIAREVTAIAEDAMRPERSFRPRLVVETVGAKAVRRLQWTDVHQGTPRTFDLEPETTPIQRGLLRILQALPIEDYL